MMSLSPDARTQTRLAVSLALLAGYVDAYGLIALGTYVSFMSGNTTQAGAMAGQGKLVAAWPSALAILFFMAGCFSGTWLEHSRIRSPRQALYGVTAALLAVVLGCSRLLSSDSQIAIAILSLAMGVMNTTLSRVGAEPVNLTFVTGTLTKVGRHLALAARQVSLTDAQGSWDTHLHRAGVLLCVWIGFLTGALLSGAASSHFGVDALLAPFLILVVLALFSRGAVKGPKTAS
jgi:uncharacterized membrane protein YoaK (UPF0700 family)